MQQVKEKTSLTEGSIPRGIILFAIPLFLGNLFQQLYNAADSLIVGNFLGSNALAAVSSSGHLIFLLVGFFNGISVGAGVVIARYYGAKEMENLQKAIHTSVAFGVLSGVLLTVIGVLTAPHLLIWMKTPEEVLPNSIVYFRIYFLGSLAFVLYNSFMGILQSVGDSKHPLYYLILSSVINIVLDLIFVGIFHYGVGSAALATIISQFVSAALCLHRLMFRSPEAYTVKLRNICLDPFMLRQIISNGLPAGLQNSIISIANVFVQSNINSFGEVAVAGCGSYTRIEGFAFLPVICFSMTLTTFISQNLGAGQHERAKKGSRFAIVCCLVLAETIGLSIYTFAPILISAFSREPEIVSCGVMMARTLTPFFFMAAFSHCIAGLMRGAGKAAVPMYVMLICWCAIRITYISIMVRIIPQLRAVLTCYPVTWLLSSSVFLFFYLKTDWMHGKTIKTA